MSAAHTTTVGCSECGGSFGPGTEGFSHCEDHAAAPTSISINLTIEGKAINLPLPLAAGDAERLAGPATFRRDELLDSILRMAIRRLDVALRPRVVAAAKARNDAGDLDREDYAEIERLLDKDD